MTGNPFLGVLLHAIGGLAAASFYVPYSKVRGWAWETFWIVGGLFSWLVAPWVVALIVAPDTLGILRSVGLSRMVWPFVFGLLWGVGGLTFGLSVRFLGVALGYAIALGFCAAFGTLIPPIFDGTIGAVIASQGGRVTLLGIGVCVVGIAISGEAGRSRELDRPAEGREGDRKRFEFAKGVLVAVFAGVLSASMSFAISAASPIRLAAEAHHVPKLWTNTPIYVVILLGGFVTNFAYCMFLRVRNGTGRDFADRSQPLSRNYLLCIVGGVAWYLQFMFYGMGQTQMGSLEFSSWTLHMASIIIFSTLWGIGMREWSGTSLRTQRLVSAGLAVLILSTIVVGYGNYLDARSKQAAKTSTVSPQKPVRG